jgi:hypothetical protein
MEKVDERQKTNIKKRIKNNNYIKKSTYIYTVFTMAISFGLANHKCPLIIHYDLELITNNQEIIP